jgi:hypothetical protein
MSHKKVPAAKNLTTKQTKELAATTKLRERTEQMKKTAADKDKETQARREQLILEGVTPKILDDDCSAVGSDDMEWDDNQWEVVDHAVDWTAAKANFRVATEMRSGDSGATQTWMWGQRQASVFDGLDESVLDDCIRRKCDHAICKEPAPPVVRIKKPAEVEKPKKTKACDHSSCNLGPSHHPDPEVNPGWCAAGKFLFGVECAGCGSPFVQKAPPAGAGGGKERGHPQVPSTGNVVHCCNDLRNRTGASDGGCSHACCKRC